MPTVSLVGPLQLRLVWLPPDGGEPEGGYRIIAIDNERRLIAHSLIVAPSVTSFALNNEAAQQFSPTTGYTGAPTDPVLNIAPGHSYRLFIASVDAEGLAGAPGCVSHRGEDVSALAVTPYYVRRQYCSAEWLTRCHHVSLSLPP